MAQQGGETVGKQRHGGSGQRQQHHPLDAVDRCFRKLRPDATPKESYTFSYQFFPFMYGVYPYVFPSEKQIRAMKTAGMKLKKRTVYQLAYPAILKMLEK